MLLGFSLTWLLLQRTTIQLINRILYPWHPPKKSPCCHLPLKLHRSSSTLTISLQGTATHQHIYKILESYFQPRLHSPPCSINPSLTQQCDVPGISSEEEAMTLSRGACKLMEQTIQCQTKEASTAYARWWSGERGHVEKFWGRGSIIINRGGSSERGTFEQTCK